jgi:hypothetical protein
MENLYKFSKLEKSIVSTRLNVKLKYNTEVQVPKNHICIAVHGQTKEKQRMFEGTHKVRALMKKRGLLDLGFNLQKTPYELFLINREFTFENLWGGRFLFEDKPTKNEMEVGVNGIIQYSLKDFENLYELMEKDGLNKIDLENVNSLYDKERKSMNNAIITYLSNWSNTVDSIKDLKNKKTETEQSILSNLNKTESNPFIEVTKMTINEYVSVEAEENRLLKNDSNTKKFVRESSGEEEKQFIIIEKENLDEPLEKSSEEKGEE